MNKRQRICKNCRFWSQAKNVRYTATSEKVVVGDCRLNPPVISFSGPHLRACYWPQTSSDDWCGQWQDSKPSQDSNKETQL